MVKEETWSVSIDRAKEFFQEQSDVAEESAHCFVFGSCHIALTELPPKGTGIWAIKRILVRMEGEESDVSVIYHRFFLQFLSAGG